MKNKRNILRTSTVQVCSLICILLAFFGTIVNAQQISLVSTNAYTTGVLLEDGSFDNRGNFSITVNITTGGSDLRLKKDFDITNSTHYVLTLRASNMVISGAEISSCYITSSSGSGNDTSDWYEIPEGNTRTFQFSLRNLTPIQTGSYTWELNSIEFYVPTPDQQSIGFAYNHPVDGSNFRTSSLQLTQSVPEPSCVILVLLGAIGLIHNQTKRKH